MALDTLWLMDELGWDSAHFVGHSLGGPVALEIALTASHRVRSLSLLCTVAAGKDATRLRWPILWLGLRSRIGTMRSRRRAFLNIVMPRKALAAVDQDELAERMEPLFGHDLAVQPPIAMKQLSALRRYDATGRLGQIGVPTLVMAAAHDPIAPPRYGKELASGIPRARFVQFDDAAHGLPIQHARDANDLLRDHFGFAEKLVG
jgi:3-oxoadipate enol-lactonase